MRRAAAIALVAALAAAGCGSDAARVTPPPVPSGRFVGSDGKGTGISVDFTGYDAEKLRIAAALKTDSPLSTVGIVSVVNRTTGLLPLPALWAVVRDGREVPLELAGRTIRRGKVVALPDPGPYVPVRSALTLYVVFPGTVPEIHGVVMRVGVGRPVKLTPEPAGDSRALGGAG